MTEELKIAMTTMGRLDAVALLIKKKFSNQISDQEYEECLQLFPKSLEEEKTDSEEGDPIRMVHVERDHFSGGLPDTYSEGGDSHQHTDNQGGSHPDTPKGSSQRSRLWRLLLDGHWHNTNEIQEKVYGKDHLGTANIKARIHEIRKALEDKGNTYEIVTAQEVGSLYRYRLQRTQ